jgi:hypothetical protein
MSTSFWTAVAERGGGTALRKDGDGPCPLAALARHGLQTRATF